MDLKNYPRLYCRHCEAIQPMGMAEFPEATPPAAEIVCTVCTVIAVTLYAAEPAA